MLRLHALARAYVREPVADPSAKPSFELDTTFPKFVKDPKKPVRALHVVLQWRLLFTVTGA